MPEDIVERLREEPGQYSSLFVKAMFNEAADEIEKLRAALKQAAEICEEHADDAAEAIRALGDRKP